MDNAAGPICGKEQRGSKEINAKTNSPAYLSQSFPMRRFNGTNIVLYQRVNAYAISLVSRLITPLVLILSDPDKRQNYYHQDCMNRKTQNYDQGDKIR